MSNRRTFIKQGLLASLGLMGLPGRLDAMLSGSAGENASSDKPLLRLGVVTDIHYVHGHEHGGNRFYALGIKKLNEAIATFNAQGVDCIVCLGDIFDVKICKTEAEKQSYVEINEAFAKAKCPVHRVLGNHDYIDAYGTEAQTELMKNLQVGPPYYEVSMNNLRLLFIDSNDISLYSRAKGTPEYAEAERMQQELKSSGAPNHYDWNGMVGKEQIAWMERTLADAQQKGQTALVFSHMPFLPAMGASQWNGNRVDAVLQKYPCVVAALSGHHHIGASTTSGHVCYYTFCGMIEPESNRYAIATLYPDRLEVEGFGTHPSMVMPLTITK